MERHRDKRGREGDRHRKRLRETECQRRTDRQGGVFRWTESERRLEEL